MIKYLLQFCCVKNVLPDEGNYIFTINFFESSLISYSFLINYMIRKLFCRHLTLLQRYFLSIRISIYLNWLHKTIIRLSHLFQISWAFALLYKSIFKATFSFLFNMTFKTYPSSVGTRGGSRAAATSKVVIVNGWKPLIIITKSSTLDVVAVPDPPLST